MPHQPPSLDRDFDGLGYAFAPNANDNSPGVREAALWCAVIEQACIDAGIIKPVTASRRAALKGPDYEAAKRFLLRDKADFYLVCGLAGVNPAVIRMGASKQESCRRG